MQGTFELMVEKVIRERENDTIIRAAADKAFRGIKGWFESIGPEGFRTHFGNPSTGYFGIDLKVWGKASIWPGQLHFTTVHHPSHPPDGKAGAGTDRKGNAVIRFYADMEPGRFQEVFPQHFHTRWTGHYLDFVHEYAHWYDKGRRAAGFSVAARDAVAAGDMTGYLNSPEELQAHFIEVTAGFFDRALAYRKLLKTQPAVALKAREAFFGSTFSEFLGKVKAHATWWRWLTPENERRFVKRLAGTWDELQAELSK